MLRWLLSWIIETRFVFVFFDGQRRRKIDPWKTAMAVWSRPGFDPDALMEVVRSKPLTVRVFEASAEIAKHVREAFDVKTLADGGLTDGECVHLLNDFMDMVGDVKKNTSTSPIAAAPTERATPSGYSLDNPPMKFDSDSGPMLNGKPYVEGMSIPSGLKPAV